jgi:predicted nucleic acid-binding protein
VTTDPAFPIRCVVDASMLIKTVFNEPGSDLAAALLATVALDARAAPDLAYLECAGTVATAVRRGPLGRDDAPAVLARLFQLRLTIHPTAPLLPSALHLALRHAISVYDAVYVALAEALDIPLITADAALVRAVGGTATRLLLLTDFGAV